MTRIFADAWNYDAYGSYYYTTFFNSNTGFLNFQAINNALLVLITGAPVSGWDNLVGDRVIS